MFETWAFYDLRRFLELFPDVFQFHNAASRKFFNIEQRAKGQLQPEEHAILSLVVDTIFRGHQVLNVPYHMSHILIA